MTCREYIDNHRQGNEIGTYWVHGIDMLEHVLKGNFQDTIYNNGTDRANHLYEMTQAMGNRGEYEGFDEVIENAYAPKRQWRSRMDNEGDLVIDAYLNRDDRMFETWEKEISSANAVSVLLDMAIAWGERDDDDMIARHRKCYEIASKCEGAQIPCRVIGCMALAIDEYGNGRRKAINVFVTIKDYLDPIFPGIWGAFETNNSTNRLVNVLAVYLLGTGTGGNGNLETLKVTDYFTDDEDIHAIDPKRLNTK